MMQRTTPRTSRSPWLRHVGLINDYVRIPYANGSSFASQFLYREFKARGHQVTVVGPRDPDATPAELPQSHVSLPSLPLRNHPGVYLPLPTRRSLAAVAAQRFDVMLGQASSELLELGVYMRATQHVPFLCVNTIHLPSVYNVVLPDALLNNPRTNRLFADGIVPWAERQRAAMYNQTDGIIVLSEKLADYWQQRGVTVPIHVIPRSVDPDIFDRQPQADLFDPRAKPGYRLLCVCRHTREKNVSRLLTLFAKHIYRQVPEATLTLVGDGPDHDAFKAQAQALGIADRTFFPGEYSLKDIPAFYRYADVFVYTSLSETYGQVVSEAAWCGMPVVAFADDKGVSHQVKHGLTGLLVEPGPDEDAADSAFAAHVLQLLQNQLYRRSLACAAQQATRERAHPARCIERYYDAFDAARDHCRASVEKRVADIAGSYVCLARWATVQSTLAALGCLRAPATLNRHGRMPPPWDVPAVAGSERIGGGLTEAGKEAPSKEAPIKEDVLRGERAYSSNGRTIRPTAIA